MISGYWTKDVLFWEKDSIMLRGKKKRLQTPPEWYESDMTGEDPLKILGTEERNFEKNKQDK